MEKFGKSVYFPTRSRHALLPTGLIKVKGKSKNFEWKNESSKAEVNVQLRCV